MEKRIYFSKNELESKDITKILTGYYKFYIENGRFPSSYTKNKEERNIYSRYYKVISNLDSLSLTKEQLNLIELIKSIKEKHNKYIKLLSIKERMEDANEREIYNFLIMVDNDDPLTRAFRLFVDKDLSDKKKRDLNRIDNLRRKVNYLSLEISMFIEENDISPSNIYSKKNYIRSYDGKVMTLKCAYDFIREHVNYMDDNLVDRLNKCRRIKKKLVKQEINS